MFKRLVCVLLCKLILTWKSYNGNSFFLEHLFWENSKEYDFFALIQFNISGKLWCADSKGRQLDAKRWRCVSSDSLYSNNCYHNVFKECHEKSKRGLNKELYISVSSTENYFFFRMLQSSKYKYCITSVIRHLCNPFHCVIRHWFPFLCWPFSMFSCTVPFVTLFILTQNFSPSTCCIIVDLKSFWYYNFGWTVLRVQILRFLPQLYLDE